MNYQWYPGHMMKAKRMMQENIKLIDLVIELVDARVPMSSRNPDIDELSKNKSRMILLNKSDLADGRYNEKWTAYFKEKGFHVLEINSKTGAGIKSIQGLVQEACKEKTERDRKRGIKNRPVRAMVVGIPNVGKSTFINSFAGRACAKTGNKPGVTKGKQWIRLNQNLELLDTPGILWPRFENQMVGERLAMIGSINDEILHADELAVAIVKYVMNEYPGLLQERYKIEETKDAFEILKAVCISRKCFLKGEEPDIDRASRMIIDDFRSGKIGRITLEYPEEWQ
ncbi:MAG: ribosome biogenesis GTPase YlqF [Suilimivivens sp.]